MPGYFKVERDFLDSDFWLSEPFTKPQAWIDLFGTANHSEGFFVKRGVQINLERSQNGRSELTLMKRWKWSRNKVRRFLKRLQKDEMITLKQDNKTSIITICNYEVYQGYEKEDDTPNDTPNDTPKGHQKDTKRNTNNKKENVKKKNVYTEPFERWFKNYPKRNGRRVGKKNASIQFEKIPKEEWIDLKTATTNYALECGEFPKDAERFLKKDFWKDYIKPADKDPDPGESIAEKMKQESDSTAAKANEIL